MLILKIANPNNIRQIKIPLKVIPIKVKEINSIQQEFIKTTEYNKKRREKAIVVLTLKSTTCVKIV